ncbi:C/H/G cyclin [Atractiella rhizophila]|nr:C/H/G cyclin [Atractiella rhizophila]
MAANYYLSTQANYWTLTPHALHLARTLDYQYATPLELSWICIWTANVAQKLSKRLHLRQQVTSTAIVYFRRFYIKNSYCNTDIPLVLTACLYMAAKAEETPVHIRTVCSEARQCFIDMGITTFPTDSSKVAECEFYVISDLEFCLKIFHPYSTLYQLTGRDVTLIALHPVPDQILDQKVEVDDVTLQMAWFLINDLNRTTLPLIHPPHLLAIAALFFAFSLGSRPESTLPEVLKDKEGKGIKSLPRTSSLGSISAGGEKTSAGSAGVGRVEAVEFLASLNVDMDKVVEITREMLSLYESWKLLEQGAEGRTGKGTTAEKSDRMVAEIWGRMRDGWEEDYRNAPTQETGWGTQR